MALLALATPAAAQYALAVDPSAGPNAPGAMVLEWSVPLDLDTLESGIVVEQLQADFGWVPLPPDEVVIGKRPGEPDSNDVLVMLRSGWPRGTSYRIRLLPALTRNMASMGISFSVAGII